MSSLLVKKEKITVFFLTSIFIFLYGSAFIAAKMGFPYAEPLVFLAVRFTITTVVLLILAWLLKSPWPASAREVGHIAVSGVFLVSVYSASAWISMFMGVPPAITALITALQPIVVSLISYFLFNKLITGRQWMGLVLGFLGVSLVVVHHSNFSAHYMLAILMSIISLLSLSIGNLYQKNFCHSMNIITGGVIQSFVSGVISFAGAWFFEPFKIHWSGEFIFALLWMAVVVSAGANSILYFLLRRGESHSVASLFYLIPAVTALIAYFVFGSTLNFIQMVGMLASVAGVALVNFSFGSFRKKYQKELG